MCLGLLLLVRGMDPYCKDYRMRTYARYPCQVSVHEFTARKWTVRFDMDWPLSILNVQQVFFFRKGSSALLLILEYVLIQYSQTSATWVLGALPAATPS